MKLMEKTVIDDDLVKYQWQMEEVTTEKSCLKLALSACKIGELVEVECRGYEDMDTHENYCSFRTQKEFAAGLDQIRKIDADRISLNLKAGGERVVVSFGPCSDYESGNWVTVYGTEETVKKVSAEIQKLIG